MRKKIIKVNELPIKISYNDTFEMKNPNLGYFTHSFFKYPCKFIPQIPKWAIMKYSKEKDIF